jgi:hypothetical protein
MHIPSRARRCGARRRSAGAFELELAVSRGCCRPARGREAPRRHRGPSVSWDGLPRSGPGTIETASTAREQREPSQRTAPIGPASSAPPVRPVRPVTCPADRAPLAAASRPAVPVALVVLSLGFPCRPGTQSLSSQPATPSLFWETGAQGWHGAPRAPFGNPWIYMARLQGFSGVGALGPAVIRAGVVSSSQSLLAAVAARPLRRMECDCDEASRSARQHGSGCRTDGLACNARPMMASLRRRTGGSCCGALRYEAPSIAATLLETLYGVG